MHRVMLITGVLGIALLATSSDLAGQPIRERKRTNLNPSSKRLSIWRKTAEFKAAEAVQAAAADRKFVFAIDSRQVAKFDRRTKRKLAVSTGEATHLNSGFAWKGNLLCAHSNYPKQPEQSEIKILDAKSMKLSSFKKFGNYGGSLTWVVRHRGFWWCNFARYADKNGQTFLVKFDDEWRERGRWTYPRVVIRQLGKYSLSGGLWFGNSLLVTGHDKPEIYRLSLPSRGRVLKYRGKESVPFTGQGFAIDAPSGGLVGISRARRHVIFVYKQASPHPHALPNPHKPGVVDNPKLVPFIVSNPRKLPGIVVDETEAKLVGKWRYSTHTPPYVGIGYLHDQKKGKGKSSVTYTPKVPRTGFYEVRISHCYNIRRSTNTPVTIHHADGETTVRINQTETPKHARLFRSLGKFRFRAGKKGWVRISTGGTDGKYVIADAIQLLPVRSRK